MEKYELINGVLDNGPGVLTRVFTDLMVMLTCTARSLVEGNGVPEFCYDNTIADIAIEGGVHQKDNIDAHFDLLSWEGLLTFMFLSFTYNGVVDTMLYWVEMYPILGWYGLDTELTAGSATFLFNGFDLIAGRYFWGLY